MRQQDLEALVDQLGGLKTVMATLVQICTRKADSIQESQGDIEGTATDWRADSATLRSIIPRLRN